LSRATPPERIAQAGFTLLEVLVALALLAAAMAALGSLSSVGRRANRAEIERIGLAQVARRVFAEMTERNFSGGATGAADGYAWRIDVEPLASPPASPQPAQAGEQQQQGRPQTVWIPYRVNLRVTGPSGVSTQIVTVRLGAVGR